MILLLLLVSSVACSNPTGPREVTVVATVEAAMAIANSPDRCSPEIFTIVIEPFEDSETFKSFNVNNTSGS